MADVKVTGLVKTYGGMTAFHSINLDIRNGEIGGLGKADRLAWMLHIDTLLDRRPFCADARD